jgi:hypothetical protein
VLGIGTSTLDMYEVALADAGLDAGDAGTFLDHLHTLIDDVSGNFTVCEGSGLYALQSTCALLAHAHADELTSHHAGNHSCRPNASPQFPLNSHRLQLKATRRIRAGEEVRFCRCCADHLTHCAQILISYLDGDDLEKPKAARQRVLREMYLFDCKCARCTGVPMARTPRTEAAAGEHSADSSDEFETDSNASSCGDQEDDSGAGAAEST